MDFVPNDQIARYREAVSFIRNDPLSLGALVTTHKVNLFKASGDLFDELDPFAQTLGEIGCISKRGDRLCGHAKDPITVGKALFHRQPARQSRRNAGSPGLSGWIGDAGAPCPRGRLWPLPQPARWKVFRPRPAATPFWWATLQLTTLQIRGCRTILTIALARNDGLLPFNPAPASARASPSTTFL
jgi:hypothetical protein